CDEFQFGRRHWQNRQRFPGRKDEEKPWLTVPIQKGDGTMLKDKAIYDDLPWRREHWERIRVAYKDEPYFERYASFFEELYNREWSSLNALSEAITRYQSVQLGIDTLAIRMSHMGRNPHKRARAIAKYVEQTVGKELLEDKETEIEYLSGLGGKKYLERPMPDSRPDSKRKVKKRDKAKRKEKKATYVPERNLIEKRGIKVTYVDYPEDDIGLRGVNPFASGLEVLSQLGPDAKDLLEQRTTAFDRSILQMQRLAMKIIGKVKRLEDSKPNISFANEKDLEYYVKLLEFIYGKIEKLSLYRSGERQTGEILPIIIDAENPPDRKAGEQLSLEDKAKDAARIEIIILGKYAQYYEPLVRSYLEKHEKYAKKVEDITAFAPKKSKATDRKHELLGDNELLDLYEKDGKTVRTKSVSGDGTAIKGSAFVIMAAGSGTRLEEIFKLPHEEKVALGLEDMVRKKIGVFSKSTFPLTRIKQKSPFQLIVESLAAISRDNSVDIPVVIVCTYSSRPGIERLLEENKNFGLKKVVLKEDVSGPPMFDKHGRVLRKGKDVVVSGGGTGGTLETLAYSGLTIASEGRMSERDVTPFEWLAENNVEDICLLQCDMPYNSDILTALGSMRTTGENKVDLLALGYDYPKDEDADKKHKYQVGTIIRVELEGMEVSPEELRRLIDERAYFISLER
ncbi:WbqC family protein, partial [Candidatus Omnitrophota bacterium]